MMFPLPLALASDQKIRSPLLVVIFLDAFVVIPSFALISMSAPATVVVKLAFRAISPPRNEMGPAIEIASSRVMFCVFEAT